MHVTLLVGSNKFLAINLLGGIAAGIGAVLHQMKGLTRKKAKGTIFEIGSDGIEILSGIFDFDVGRGLDLWRGHLSVRGRRG